MVTPRKLAKIDSSALKVRYEIGKKRAKINDIQRLANEDFDQFIDWYWDSGSSRRLWSVIIRAVAILSGLLATLAINPLVLERYFDNDPNMILSRVAVFVALAGGCLTLDWAYSVTHKYTVWTAQAFDYSVDKTDFNAAFNKMFSGLTDDELTKEHFDKALNLALDTLSEFKEKARDETEEWATNLQSVVSQLRNSNKIYQTESQKASVKAMQEHEAEAQEQKKKALSVGLTIKLGKNTKKDSRCVVMDADHSKIFMETLAGPNESISTFLAKGQYVVKMKIHDDVVSSRAVTLDKDKTVTF